ncbi:ATP-binding protein [Agrococcus beijingensis]|uniref:ATP-binding protein n=1 Tax=Agrococcus beijingensis TaxID=3068634 RepID=UPI00274247E4|nr:ATP-binding protein [Agrococcus sp. REN33]
MRNPVDNPFTPGSDTVPEVWAGRTEQLSDWRDAMRPRLLKGLPERGRTILGEPGLGKSSLVRRIAQHAERSGDWVTPQLRIPLGADPMKLVAAATLQLADSAGLASSRERRLKQLLQRVEAVAVSGASLSVRGSEGPEPHTALTELLVEVGRAAIEARKVALIHVDEVQNVTDERALSQLLIALGDAITFETEVTLPGGAQIRRTLPIAVYLTGLPDFEDRAGAHKGATFARRFKTTLLAPIGDDDLAGALQDFVDPGWEVSDESGGVQLVRFEQDAVSAVIDLCRGEPFLFQLAGQHAWNADTTDTVTREQVARGWRSAQREAVAHVERILGRLPQREREFVEAMARIPAQERRLTRIAAEAGFAKPSDAGTTSRRLDTVRGIIERGTQYTFRHRALEAFLTSDWPNLE